MEGHSTGTQVPGRAERRGGQELERLAGQAMKAECSGWSYCWLGEGSEAAGIRPEGRAFPALGEEMSEAGRAVTRLSCLFFGEPPDAIKHVRWCERGRPQSRPLLDSACAEGCVLARRGKAGFRRPSPRTGEECQGLFGQGQFSKPLFV